MVRLGFSVIGFVFCLISTFCADTIDVNVLVYRQQRGAAKWSPDAEFMKQFSSPVMYPDEVTSLWKMPPYNSKLYSFVCIEYWSKNVSFNFR